MSIVVSSRGGKTDDAKWLIGNLNRIEQDSLVCKTL